MKQTQFIENHLALIVIICNILIMSGAYWIVNTIKEETKNFVTTEKLEKVIQVNNDQHDAMTKHLVMMQQTLALQAQNNNTLLDHEQRLRIVELNETINGQRIKNLEEVRKQ